MKKYKVRLNCSSFVDVVVEAKNKKEAIRQAFERRDPCEDMGMEFGEFLEVSEDEELS